MTMVYLKHPDHGVKVAYLEAEATNDEKNGWMRFDFHAEQQSRKAELVAPDEPEDAPKRRGRKPKAAAE